MFRQLAGIVGYNPVLTGYRPSQLAEFLESTWFSPRNPARQVAFGPNLGVFHQDMARAEILDPLPPALADPPPLAQPVAWHHLVYAFLLENTRMVEIFRRVVQEWLVGERLPLPSQATQRWLQATEQLFFGNPWGYSVRAVTSALRPDSGAVRRNAYYRLLGMDLTHGMDSGQPHPYVKPEIANREFATVWETLVGEVWRGYANRFTVVAENLTDDNAILTLVRRIREMLRSRRLSGALSREEFDAVAMLSWFHLTVEYDTAVVMDLNAAAEGEANRLIKIGDRVGVPAHSRCDSYFQLAEPMSNVLLAIESNSIALASDLYAGFYTPDMLEIITHWSVATGRNIKDPTQRPSVGSVLQSPASATQAAAPGRISNGSRISHVLR